MLTSDPNKYLVSEVRLLSQITRSKQTAMQNLSLFLNATKGLVVVFYQLGESFHNLGPAQNQ